MDRELALRRLRKARAEVNAARTRVEADALVGADATAVEVRELGEMAAAEVEREMDQSLVDMVERRLSEIDAAEARVAGGTYGRCESCGTKIADARLEAVPWARRCTEHEQAREQLRTGLEDRR